jgi:hypothetical protein
MKKYLAFDIGCIECGEESQVIGIYSRRSEAQDAAAKAREKQAKNWEGQHSFEVFTINV